MSEIFCRVCSSFIVKLNLKLIGNKLIIEGHYILCVGFCCNTNMCICIYIYILQNDASA